MGLAGQDKVWRDLAQRLQHETPLVRAGMGQGQLRGGAASRARRQSSPGPAGAARSGPSSAAGQIPFPAPAAWPAGIRASPPLAAPGPLPHSQTRGEPGGQSTGVVCQSEDLSIGLSDNSSQPLHRPQNVSPGNPQDSTPAPRSPAPRLWTVDFGLWTLDFRLHFSPSTSCMS